MAALPAGGAIVTCVRVPRGFSYQLFTMIHAPQWEELHGGSGECYEFKSTGIDNYQVLHSVKEYKKVSMLLTSRVGGVAEGMG